MLPRTSTRSRTRFVASTRSRPPTHLVPSGGSVDGSSTRSPARSPRNPTWPGAGTTPGPRAPAGTRGAPAGCAAGRCSDTASSTAQSTTPRSTTARTTRRIRRRRRGRSGPPAAGRGWSSAGTGDVPTAADHAGGRAAAPTPDGGTPSGAGPGAGGMPPFRGSRRRPPAGDTPPLHGGGHVTVQDEAAGTAAPGAGSGFAPPPATEGIGARVGRGAAWGLLTNIVLRLGSLLSGIVVARLLSPSDYGVYAIGLVALTLLQSFNELGVSLALVRWQDDVRRIAPTVMTIAIGTSSLLYAATFVAAPAYCAAMGSPQAVGVLRLMCLSVIIDGVATVPLGLINRSFRQRQRFVGDAATFL